MKGGLAPSEPESPGDLDEETYPGGNWEVLLDEDDWGEPEKTVVDNLGSPSSSPSSCPTILPPPLEIPEPEEETGPPTLPSGTPEYCD